MQVEYLTRAVSAHLRLQSSSLCDAWSHKNFCCRFLPVFTAAQPESAFPDPAAQKVHIEDFEFTELSFVKSSRMSKRWLLFSCFVKVC